MTFSKLSCDGCRALKVRCSREEPPCQRCHVSRVSCHYSKRRPRTTKSSNPGLDIQQCGTLSSILNRLERLESVLPAITTSAQNETIEDDSECPSSKNRVGDNGSLDAILNSIDIDAEERTTKLDDEDDVEPLLYGIIKQATGATLAAIEKSPALSKFELSTQGALLELNEALAVIHDLKRYRIVALEEEEELDLPKDRIAGWIQSGNTFYGLDFFIALIDWELVKTVPKLIESPHVKLDPSIELIYYNALYCGWLLSDDIEFPFKSRGIPEKIYRRCLALMRTCPQTEDNLLPRLVGSVLTSWMAIENFDFVSAFKLHREACRLARQLKFDQLDDPAQPPTPNTDENESKRKGFWQLVHSDYIFQVFFGKPAVITAEKFNVNLPSLKLGETVEALADAICDTAFIVLSRIAFIIGEFFQVMEDNPEAARLNDQNLNWKVDSLCDEIESLLVEWRIEEILEMQGTDNKVGKWLLGDLLIQGYAAILLMHQKWYRMFEDHQSEAILERSLRVSRKLLKAFIAVSESQVRLGLISLNLAGAYSFMALFTLYICLLECHVSPNDMTPIQPSAASLLKLEDIAMMNRLCEALKSSCRSNHSSRSYQASHALTPPSLISTPGSAESEEGGSEGLKKAGQNLVEITDGVDSELRRSIDVFIRILQRLMNGDHLKTVEIM